MVPWLGGDEIGQKPVRDDLPASSKSPPPPPRVFIEHLLLAPLHPFPQRLFCLVIVSRVVGSILGKL